MIHLRNEEDDRKKGRVKAVESNCSIDFQTPESLFFDAYHYSVSDLIKDELASLEVLSDLDSLTTVIVWADNFKREHKSRRHPTSFSTENSTDKLLSLTNLITLILTVLVTLIIP